MRKTTVLALFLAFFLTAAGSTDPLVTQSYLTGAYTQELDAAIPLPPPPPPSARSWTPPTRRSAAIRRRTRRRNRLRD